ncbi:MAG: FHA domain-containing protein [Gammaproteobacteria bacterium]
MTGDLDNNFKVIMSADVAGSTALYEAVGDDKARAMVSDCLSALKTLCSEHGGETIAEVGDQVIAKFDDPTEAAAAATEIHVHLNEQYGNAGGARIQLRIGLHYGMLTPGGDPLMSETAKVANWAADRAKPEQTLATRAMIDRLPRIFRAVSRYVDDETWNFVSLEHVEIYEIIWDVESITAYNGEQPQREENSYDSVTFEYEDQTVTVDTARPVISIGRQKQNDMVINRDLISRQHLSVQFSRGRCTVTDNSTNGTLVRLENGEEYEIKRESLRLGGSGELVVGSPPDRSAAGFAIRFRCG